MRGIGVLLLAALLTGCGGDDPATVPPTSDQTSAAEVETAAYGQECGQAVEAAASVDDGQDTVEDLDPAITACASLDELGAAVADYPDALDGVDVETFVGNRCQYSEDEAVTGSTICAERG